jgi:hypothetical protein
MSRRLATRTLTGVDASFLLSTACDVYDGVIPDPKALFASAVLRLHIPEDISALGTDDFVEIRKRYSDLREAFPLYLRDLSDLYRINDVRSLTQLQSKLGDIGRSIDADVAKIQRSRIGEAVRRWVPIGLTSALPVSALFIPDQPAAAVATALGTVAVSVIGGLLSPRPLKGQFQGVRSLLLSARLDIGRANRLPLFLDPEPLY